MSAAKSYPDHAGWKADGPSRAAANAIEPVARTLRDRVLNVIRRAPVPPTADEIAAGLGENILSIRPRVSELHRQGWIIPAGDRGRNISGMTATRWRSAPPLPNEKGES